jgi:uncharacterized membrane protein
MNEIVENMNTGLGKVSELIETVLNALSLICIVGGVVIALVRSIQEKRRNPGIHPLHTTFRMLFGGWLVVALEFQLAADIVATINSPTTTHLIQLGAVAVIRTFLNYFLNKELKEQVETSRTHIENNKVKEGFNKNQTIA